MLHPDRDMNHKAKAIDDALGALCVVGREDRALLRDAIRFYIAASVESADAAIVDLFAELEICFDVTEEEGGRRR
jgi:hypothetical protein